MEHMKYGSLIEYFSNSDDENLVLPALVYMAAQIANGMSFIHAQGYIHRALAGQNILVGDNYVCKIAGFGKARRVPHDGRYINLSEERFLIKWRDTFSLYTKIFTTKSDVWSFGILMTEILDKGTPPYYDMTDGETIKAVEKGYRMPAPRNCTKSLYQLILNCWNDELDNRPTFDLLQRRLDKHYKDLHLSWYS